MYLLRRITPFLLSLFVVMALGSLIWYAPLLQAIVGESSIGSRSLGVVLGSVLSAAVLAMLMVGAEHPLASRARFLLFPFVLLGSVFILLTFTETRTWSTALILFTAVLLWFWYESLYMFWQQPQWYQPYTLQRLASFLYVIAFYFFISALSGLYVYLQMRFWAVAVCASIIVSALLLDTFFLAQMSKEQAVLATILGATIGLEWFLAISYLPTHPILISILMALYLYLWSGLAKLWAQDTCVRPHVVPYIAISLCGFFMTIGSALWII